MIEDGGIEFFFGGKVAEDHGFRNARSLRDFLGGRTAKTLVGKKSHCYAQDLRASLVAGHSRPREGRADVFKCVGFFSQKS